MAEKDMLSQLDFLLDTTEDDEEQEEVFEEYSPVTVGDDDYSDEEGSWDDEDSDDWEDEVYDVPEPEYDDDDDDDDYYDDYDEMSHFRQADPGVWVDNYTSESRVFGQGFSDEYDPEVIAASLFQLDTVLGTAIDVGASDIHMISGDGVTFRILGQQVRQPQFGELTATMMEEITNRTTSTRQNDTLVVERSLDTAYVIKQGRHRGRRCRLSVGHDINGRYMVFRIISENIPTPEDLGLPEELLAWTELSSGLVLMNGPTGSGKSTTLASLMQRMIDSRAGNIITLEKPVEYVFNPTKSTIVQRDVGHDVRTYKDGLTAAMRGDPDIIMVGEVRNREEVDALLEATETGHLTISTIHASSSSVAVSRIANLYDGADRARVLSSLSTVAKGFANQRLLLTPDEKGRYAVREYLPITREVSGLILQGDQKAIYDWQAERGLTMENKLVEAILEGKVRYEDARRVADVLEYFDYLWGQRKKVL